MTQTRIKDLMTKNPVIIPPTTTLKEAAQKMQSVNCGMLIVGAPGKPQGIITDRDIVLRAVAKGKDINKEKVKDYMTRKVHSVKKEDTTDRAANLMRKEKISRVLIEDEDGRPCGVLTFGRIIREDGSMTQIAEVIECAVGQKAA